MKELSIRGATWKVKDINPNTQEVILLVHGHPFNHTMWKYQYEVLDNFRLLVPDLKGYGESDYNFEKIFIEEQALDLALLLDQLNIEKIHLIGLSMGGQIIVEFQRLFPHRVKSLVICASLPNGESDESYKNRLKLADEITALGMLEYTKNDIYKYVNLDELKKESEPFNHLFKMMSETKVKGAVASHKGRAERRDNSNYVQTIEVPTLIIAGEKDYFFKVDSIQALAKKIPNSQFEIIKNSGHLPNLEHPEIFNKMISNFYEKRKSAFNIS